jgi:hypothetical protein
MKPVSGPAPQTSAGSQGIQGRQGVRGLQADAGHISAVRQGGETAVAGSAGRLGGGGGGGERERGMSEEKMEKRIASTLEEFVEIRVLEEVRATLTELPKLPYVVSKAIEMACDAPRHTGCLLLLMCRQCVANVLLICC